MKYISKRVSRGKMTAFGVGISTILAASSVPGCLQRMPEEGLVKGSPWLLGTTLIPLKDFGYEQQEFFIKGKAHAYTSAGPLTEDGKWTVEPAEEADFKTRIVVYRPKDPAKFNGTVLIEWFNVSGGTEASSEWIMAHTELMRSGYAWVGVSAQQGGIDGTGLSVLPISLPLKTINPFRYKTLHHPGDKFAYDIFHQAAKAVLQPQRFRPLGELPIERAIASGESQSADFLMTYVNAIVPREKLFDGFFIHSRLHGAASLLPELAPPEEILALRTPVQVRNDLDVPVLMLQTETDLTVLETHSDRQPDTDMFRLWEVAGTAHADHYVGSLGLRDEGNNPAVAKVTENRYAIPLLVKCGKPINAGPQHFVVKAAIAALDTWMRTGVAPAPADRLIYDEATESLKRDHLGIAVGGIRTPFVDVPVATLSGEGQPGDDLFCSLYGTTRLFDSATLKSLYPDQQTYASAVVASTDDAVKKGYLLPPDGELIKAWARQSRMGQ